MTTSFNSPFILAKNATADKIDQISVASLLQSGEALTSVTLSSLVPSTTPALVFLPSILNDSTVQVEVRNGLENVTYGASLTLLTDQGNTYSIVVGIYVADSLALNNQFVNKNPGAFQTLMEEVQAGDAVSARITFTFPSGYSFVGAAVAWSLVDTEGRIYSQGNSYNYIVSSTSLASNLEAFAVVHVPSDVPPSISGFKYQVRWELDNGTGAPVYLFEAVKVLGPTTSPQGTQHLVELAGDTADCTLILPRLYDSVGIAVYKEDLMLVSEAAATLQGPVNGGYLFQQRLQTTGLQPSIDPYNVIWSYSDTHGQTFRELSNLFVVTPTVLGAVEDVRGMISKARTTLTGIPDTLFETSTILRFLRRGRDMFNGAAGQLTYFTMTGAYGGIREFWLMYTEVALCRAQYLMEGEKAFNFSGQAISLDVDRSQFYQAMADSIQQRLDQDVRPFKQALKKAGIDGGDGSAGKSRPAPSVGVVGIGMNPLTQLPWNKTALWAVNRVN